MGNNSDLKKHVEAITGHELIGDSTNACGDVKVLTIGGVVVTGRDGATPGRASRSF
jgi:hypothetical protein